MGDEVIHDPESLLALLAPFVRAEDDPVAEVLARRFAELADVIVVAAPNAAETRTTLRRLREARDIAMLAVRSES